MGLVAGPTFGLSTEEKRRNSQNFLNLGTASLVVSSFTALSALVVGSENTALISSGPIIGSVIVIGIGRYGMWKNSE